MCWAKAPEGFQVEGRENRVSEGSCVGGWDHVADSGIPPCSRTDLGQRVLGESPFAAGVFKERCGEWGKRRERRKGFQGAD